MTNKKKAKQDNDNEPVQYQPTLKRGQACLSCRRLKLRCSADKPTCSHCHRTGRECVYDSKEAIEIIKILRAQQGDSNETHQPQSYDHLTPKASSHTANQIQPYPMMYGKPSSSSNYSEYGQLYLSEATPSVAQMDSPYVVKHGEATLYDANLNYLHQPQDSNMMTPNWLGQDAYTNYPYDDLFKSIYNSPR